MVNFDTNLNAALERCKKEDKIVMVIVEDEDEKKTSIIQNAVSKLNSKNFLHLIPSKVQRNSSHHSDFMELYGDLGSPCLAFIEKQGIPVRVVHGISDPKVMSRCLQETVRYCNERVESRHSSEPHLKRESESLDGNRDVKPDTIESRILFRMPDYNSKTQTFQLDETVKALRTFVDTNMKPPFRYDLVTYHPYRLLTENTTLRELELFPSVVIMIVPMQSKNALSMTSGFSNLFWFMVNPIFSLWSYIVNIFRPMKQPPQPKSSRKGGQPKRKNNIHTLRDEKDDNDNDDENKTWNGNSTQQM